MSTIKINGNTYSGDKIVITDEKIIINGKDITERTVLPIKKALLEFSQFCNKDYQIWGNSARFDCGILQNAYNKLGISIPWDFRKERCVRTLVSFNPEIKNNFQSVGTAHNALSDCYFQVGYCSAIWSSLNNK